jgi:hypothetical protein
MTRAARVALRKLLSSAEALREPLAMQLFRTVKDRSCEKDELPASRNRSGDNEKAHRKKSGGLSRYRLARLD